MPNRKIDLLKNTVDNKIDNLIDGFSKLVEVLKSLGRMYDLATPEVRELLHKAIKEAEKNV